MDKVVENLETLVKQEVKDYCGAAFKSKMFFLEDADIKLYQVVTVPDHDHPDKRPLIVVMARVIDDKVIIDEDTTDRPLYEELVRVGIPREHIVLGYIGESLAQIESD